MSPGPQVARWEWSSMLRRTFGCVCVLAATTLAAARADEPRGVMVELKGGEGPIKGYLAKPQGDGPFPAIVLVHEWWGLTDWVKGNADRLAAQGYVALAVDLYKGKVTDDPDVAHQLSRLDPAGAVADLEGGIAYLRSRPFVAKGRKIGAIGWCMGGMFARLAAQASEQIGPTVVCYGMVSTEPGQVKLLKGKPVLGIFAEEDHIPVAKVEQFAEALKAQGNAVTLKVYPKAGHGFMRPGGKTYKEDAAKDAWKNIEEFFKANLMGK